MFNSPPVMVKTRSTLRKEQARMEGVRSEDARTPEGGSCSGKIAQESQHTVEVHKNKMAGDITEAAGSGVKDELFSRTRVMRSVSPSRSKRSAASSVLARKKRLMLEAEKQKAEIRMQLIDKELEADLADVDDKIYSSHGSEVDTHRSVENWMERSRQDLDKPPQEAPEYGPSTGDLYKPAEPTAGTSDGTIQMLAEAVKTLAASSVQNKPNASLLSRICTPRDLPDFSGDTLEWLHFRQAYEESTDVCNFSPKENLWRLRKCLRGPAKEAVSALLISAASPERIMATLELRFGDPDCILNRLVQDIKKLHPISQEYQKDIVPFSVKVQNFVEAVKVVGREEYVQGMSIFSLLLSKLPTVLVSKWSDYSYPLIKSGNKSRLDILSDFLNMEAIKITTTANVHTLSYRADQPANKHKHTPQAVVLQTGPITISDRSSKCQFCRKSPSHKLPKCKQFKRALRKVRWMHVKRNGLCFKCLESCNEREACPAPVCDKEGCGQAHHKLLHFTQINNNKQEDPAGEPPAERAESSTDNAPAPETVAHVSAPGNRVLLKVVPIRIHSRDGTIIDSSALLDDGSTVTLISAELAARAGFRGRRESMRVCGPWSDNEIVCDSAVVNFELSGIDNKVHTIRARSVNELCLPVQYLSVVDCNKYEYLKDVKDKLFCVDSKPKMLIGQDNYNLMLPLKIVVGKSYEPSATLTPLGWCIHGNLRVTDTVAARGRVGAHAALLLAGPSGPGAERALRDRRDLRDLHDEVRRAFELDAAGVAGKPRLNADDVRAVEQLERSAELVDGRWQVSLPWKDPDCSMPDTLPSAFKRLKGIERKMGKDPEYAERYVERVNHLFTNHFARELEDPRRGQRTWYLSHFAVDNPNKKKMRLVFDAADKVEGFCLNDYLLKGPDLLTSLWGIMLRFRENRIAVTGDIKDMFLRIQIRPRDQDSLRFLWRSNPTEPVKTYVMTSLIFGAKCSPFVAQFIKNKNATRHESTEPAAVDAICNSHYADDYIQSLPDEATAINMVRTVTNIHREGGFEIRNWTSNSVSVLNSVPKETLGAAAVRFKVDQQFEGERTLGLIWYPATDELGFDVSFKRIPECVITGVQRPTKRLMLRVIMSIFDVFGFLAPFTIQGRIMLQDTWRLNVDWDDRIPDEINKKWRDWLELLKVIDKIRLPRCYQSSVMRESEMQDETGSGVAPALSLASATARASGYGVTSPPFATSSATQPQSSATRDGYYYYSYDNLELHLFSDASLKAMSAVAYLRWKHDGQVVVASVASKCRAAPLKAVTVPRLELQAALLAARLARSVVTELKLHIVKRYFWCDSSTVLHWLNNNTRTYKTFEANRLGEIDDLTAVSEWRYVPTGLNVADIATRETFNYSSFQNEWLKGPPFLYADEASWPPNVLEPANKETFMDYVTVVQNLPADLPVPDPERFSSWLRFVRAAAVVLKFVDRCRGLTCDDECALLQRAERLALRQAQAEAFGGDVAALRAGKCLPRDSRLRKLSPYLDDGVLRMDGRIDAALDVPLETKKPIILDGRHPITRLLVRHYHTKAAHGNQESVVNDLKQKYCIIRLRPTVKSIASRCMLCRLKRAKPQMPRMGDLPPARVAHHQRPFTHCGVDLFGPMEVTVGRRRAKRYGVLFTCLTIRAIHIEIVHSLTSDSMIMALRRMASRRGWPRYLYSDNGTNLRGADTELKKSIRDLDDEVLRAEAVNNGAHWSFIPPASPEWGGAWERLIRSVKTSLRVILKERAPRDEVLGTLLAEVEGIVNGRPLTHVSVEPGSLESLTPNHFLLGSSSTLPAVGAFDDSDLFLRKQWRKAQRLADMYWQRWMKEFLPQLLPRKKWHQEQRSLRVGDLVLIADPASPRSVWPRGVVERARPGRDGRVRVVDVRTAAGVLRRSAARVAPVSVVDEGDEC